MLTTKQKSLGAGVLPINVRVKLYRKYLATHEGRHVLAKSMIRPAEEILKNPQLTVQDRKNGLRVLRWGERLLGRAQLEGRPVTEVQIGLTLDYQDFPALLRDLRKKLDAK